jgi:uncharacterized membrane protein
MNTVVQANQSDDLRQWAQIHYLLHIFGAVLTLGTLTFVAVVLNYFKRDDATGTYVRSHMDYMISSWWRFVIWTAVLAIIMTIIGFVTLGIGFFLWFIVGIPLVIFVIRMVLGLMKLSDRRPIA